MEIGEKITLSIARIGNGYLLEASKFGADYARMDTDMVFQPDIEIVREVLPALLSEANALNLADAKDNF
jgi:hypothetical protein